MGDKTYKRIAVFAIAISAGFVFEAKSQNGTPEPKYRYVTIDYYKAAAGKAQDYVRLELDLWKPIHQDRLNNGKITSWKLYGVRYPNGDEREYDYTVMTEFPEFAAMENPYSGTDFKKVLGDQKYAQMRGMTGPARKMVRQDLLRIAESTDGWSKADAKVLDVAFLKAVEGKTDDLLKVQRDYFKASSEDAVKSGLKTGWATMGLRLPYRGDTPYNWISFDAFTGLAQMETSRPKEFVDKWREKTRPAYVMLNASRVRVRGELWQLIGQTNPK